MRRAFAFNRWLLTRRVKGGIRKFVRHARDNGLRNLKSGNFEFACSRILAFPFDVGLGLGDPIVVDLDQHGADKSD